MLEREIREMAFVPRWSIVRTNRQQFLAEHTYFVCMYANDIAIMVGLCHSVIGVLLQMALWHDVEEIFSGDLPGPCKRAGMMEYRETWDAKLKGWLTKVFDKLDLRDGSHNHMNKSQNLLLEAIVKLADMMDECCEMGTELQMGNRNVEHIFADSLKRVKNATETVISNVSYWPGDSNEAAKFRGAIIDACLRSRDHESRNTRIFDTL